jgi:uncharacterized protein
MQNTIQAAVNALFLYPIKSCGGIRVDRIDFNAIGQIAGDREWAVVNRDNEMIWQGSHPRLALVTPKLERETLTLSAPNIGRVNVVEFSSGKLCEIKFWNESTKQHDSYQGYDQGDAAAEFFSIVVDAPVRLARLGTKAVQRQPNNPVHIVSLSSMAALSDALVFNAQSAVGIERFRPNIVIADHDEPLVPFIEECFIELHWHHEEETNILADLTPCVRCIVPNVDPESGAISEEPLTTIAQLSAQRHPGSPIYFGIYSTSIKRGTQSLRQSSTQTLTTQTVLTATLKL